MSCRDKKEGPLNQFEEANVEAAISLVAVSAGLSLVAKTTVLDA